MKRGIARPRGASADDILVGSNLPKSSRIPSPKRTPTGYTSRRGSRASTPQHGRSRSSSMSPTRAGTVSPSYSSKSLENLSPIRLDMGMTRSSDFQTDGGSSRNLVRYISSDMIRRLSKEDQFEHIKTLSFNLSGDKKIRYIENLDGLRNLTTLILRGHIIQRIEKIDHLTNLRHLDLSNNKISKIEGMDTLVHLQVLNLEENYIERIPLWLVKKLRLLRMIKLAHNNISSLTDVVRLRGFHDLHTLTIAGNPFCELPHHRSYVIFHLRVLNQLDGRNISSSERADASSRFSQEELDRLNRELQNTSNQLQQSQELQNKSLEELDLMMARERDMQERETRGLESREELERELDTKDDLLKKKAKELQRAQAKQYQLEQELAFIKLDAKFEPLDIPHLDSGDEVDSPYLGKSRFKRNELATESIIPATRHQIKSSDDQSKRDLDGQLAEKQRQLNEAAERLAGLQRELRETQNQVIEASQELNKLEQAATARRLTEAEKQKIRQKLAAKIQRINQMKDDVEALENDLAQSRARVQRSKLAYDELRAQLKSLDPNSTEHALVRAEMGEKEAEIRGLTQQIRDNESTLDRLLKNIAVDADAIKQLEQQLERGTASSDDALRHELEDIVGGLQDYLINVRQKADAQRAEFDNLLRDKERLIRRLAALEQEKTMMVADADDYSQLQQQVSFLGELNELLQATQDLNESIMGQRSLRSPKKSGPLLPPKLANAISSGTATPQQIEEAKRLTLDALNKSMTEMQELNTSLQDEASALTKHDAELQTQLTDAEKRIGQLHKSIQESGRRSEADKETMGRQMEEMARLQNQAGDRELEATALQKELDKLKNHNRGLAKELDSRNREYHENIGSMLSPEEVAKRLSELGDALRNGKKGKLKGSHPNDPLNRAFAGLHATVFDLIDKENKDKAKAEKALQALEKHVADLKRKLKEAQQEYKDTMEAATAAKLEAERRKHEEDLLRLDEDMRRMRGKLKEAEDDASLVRALADKEREQNEEELKIKEERARFHNAQSQAAIRDLERELGATKRGMKDRDAATSKERDHNRAKIDALHDKLQRLEEERANELANTMDAETTAAKALRDLAHAEEEIVALEDLLRAHEGVEGVRGRGSVRKLRDTLANRQNEVDRLKNALRGRNTLSQDEIDRLLDEVDALRNALASNNQHIRTMWPGYYYYVPEGGDPSGRWVCNKVRPKNGLPPPPNGVHVQGIPIDPSSHGLQPGCPGMIALQEDGTYVLVPFEGLFCNVPEHHDLEDEVNELREALERCKEKRKNSRIELEETMKLVGPLEEGQARLHHLKEVIQSHEDTIKKLVEDENRMAKEKVETAKELADLKDTLNNKLQRKHQLEERVENLLGELRTEEALIQKEEMQEELGSLERTINRRRGELKDAEKLYRETREESDRAEEKAESMMKRFETARNGLHDVEQDAEELERQASDTGTKLVRARKELRQLQEQVKEAEGRRIQLDDQCRQLARLVTNKEAEFTALEQKTDHMTGNLERLQSELILAEEKEAERLAALRESEKVLSERREEMGKMKDQALTQRDEVEGLDRMLGKKNTELQLLQENIEQHQIELSNVLKEGKADVQEKQKQIKQLRHDVDDLMSTKSDLETQVSRRKSEIAGIRESSDKASEELQNKITEVSKQKSELKHVLEMVGLEQQELDSLRRQHESKSSELAETQRRLLEERAELERINSDVGRREADLNRVKQGVEKLRSDVDCLTSQRSTLEDTVTSLMKEKDILSNTAANLEEKIQLGKKNLYEIRTGVDKSGATLDQLEQELSHVRKEVYQSNQQKAALNKEITTMSATAKDTAAEVASYKAELQDTQEQLQLLEQDLRSSTKQVDDITMEVITLREEMKSRSQEVDLLNQQVKRKKEEAQRAEDLARDRREELGEKEREIERLSRDIQREEDRLSRTVAELNSDIQRLQCELAENRDELESTIIKRDTVKRDMERLGRLEDKYEETESRIEVLEARLADREREVHQLQRERADVKGALASTEGELRATKVESDHELRRLQEKIDGLKEENERAKSRSESEIASLERMAQDHCERATRMANELNQLRAEHIRVKKEIRFLEEERERQRLEMQRLSRRIREEVDDKVEETVQILDSSHTGAVDDIKELYLQKENNEKKISTLREIQRSRSPQRTFPSSRRQDRTMQNLQEDLKAKQEEIALQIRTQMCKHREQWEARKLQSEGKLRSLKKKVDTLDELVSNTSMDSLSHSRGRDLSPTRLLPSLEERENVIPPERDYL